MTNSRLPRPVAAGGWALLSAVVLAVPAAAQSPDDVPRPRLAWLGRDQPTFERSTAPPDQTRYGPAIAARTWSGLYVGINGGYTWASNEPIGSFDKTAFSGGNLGGHLGYNWQMGRLVLGAEADIAGAWASGSRSFADASHFRSETNALSSLRLRTGLAFDNALVYATGGIAFGSFDSSLTTLGGSASSRDWLAGYAIGGGLEMKLTSSLSGRVEALYFGFDDKALNFGGGSLKSDLSTTTVRAGITYHFQ